MIARIWRGVTRAEDADAYTAYLQQTGLISYRQTPGNRGVHLLRRVNDAEAEFLFVTFWDSMEAVTSFAGDDPSVAVFYPEDDRYLIDRGETVDHFEVIPDPAP